MPNYTKAEILILPNSKKKKQVEKMVSKWVESEQKLKRAGTEVWFPTDSDCLVHVTGTTFCLCRERSKLLLELCKKCGLVESVYIDLYELLDSIEWNK